jgi:hypothetical protein
VVLVFLLSRDLKDRDKAAQVTEREEALGRLLVRHWRVCQTNMKLGVAD